MDKVFKVIEKRRSIRKYQDKPVEKEKILKIIEAARLAPSASNGQPWRFVVVTEKDTLSHIGTEALGSINKWAKNAPCIIIGCSVKKNFMTHYIGEAISGIQYHILDVGIAMEHIVLVAEEIGLSTCWMGWFNERKLKKILNIPFSWRIVSLLSVGYAVKEGPYPPKKRHALDEILIWR